MKTDTIHRIINNKAVLRFQAEAICEESHIHDHDDPHLVTCTKGAIRIVLYSPGENWNPVSPEHHLTAGETFIVPAKVNHSVKAETADSEWECSFDEGTRIYQYAAAAAGK